MDKGQLSSANDMLGINVRMSIESATSSVKTSRFLYTNIVDNKNLKKI